MAPLQHDVTLAAFESPNTEQKQNNMDSGFTVPSKVCVLGSACASWEKHKPDRQVLSTAPRAATRLRAQAPLPKNARRKQR